MTSHYLAFDLGAESGRAIFGRLHDGVLAITEVCRFSNEPLREDNSLRWNIRRLWSDILRTFTLLRVDRLDGVGVDTWGVDFALVKKSGELIENPFHYRDSRTERIMEEVCKLIGREEIYSRTGIQFLPFNTLYQLYAASRATPQTVAAADKFLTIPDLFNFWLTGVQACEYSNASTTQFLDARTRSWAVDLLARLDLPARLLPQIVQPGSVLGPLQASVSASFAGTPVVAPACHDTGSAFAAVSASRTSAILSSGTWSLLGAELSAPVISAEACRQNFTNEGGVCGTIRFLKNIAGLWLLQSCRRSWAASGFNFSYEDLLNAAAADGERFAFGSVFDPDHPSLLHPDDMPSAIAKLCMQTGQPAPDSAPAFTRAILESLALKYRAVLEALENLTGIRFEEIRIIGGGSKNRLLNQFTADATGRPVVAGPAEATAIGNIAMQMVATGAASSLSAARETIDRSFPRERFEPRSANRWDDVFRRFQHYSELTHA
jgi:rhamnulokinase